MIIIVTIVTTLISDDKHDDSNHSDGDHINDNDSDDNHIDVTYSDDDSDHADVCFHFG